jgi:hypothetical protein
MSATRQVTRTSRVNVLARENATSRGPETSSNRAICSHINFCGGDFDAFAYATAVEIDRVADSALENQTIDKTMRIDGFLQTQVHQVLRTNKEPWFDHLMLAQFMVQILVLI